ncbi:MAG TPA: LPS assembly lipoprotein LptE [Candidatus Hypogeohydataceae bacterium YC40]
MTLLWVGFLIMSFIVAACGYTSRSLLKQNVNTIYIPIFENQSYRRGLEFDMTNAFKNEILFKTRLKVVDKDRADSIFYGIITDVKESVLIEDFQANIAQSSVIVFMNFKWVDRRTGRIIVEKQNIQQRAEFSPRRVVGKEDIGTAERKAFVYLAERLKQLMEEGW